ncbi:hypothetical protein CDAR_172841 [Caerostris darwini]|uniref:Uncharacterized protein n=1 Tax=Caerostris darwini TaxID=1538125 RepID=A0AAV4S1Q2_9ARAC|nr:hypothetical protein CDAR_172841 [Caerostris darwini]
MIHKSVVPTLVLDPLFSWKRAQTCHFPPLGQVGKLFQQTRYHPTRRFEKVFRCSLGGRCKSAISHPSGGDFNKAFHSFAQGRYKLTRYHPTRRFEKVFRCSLGGKYKFAISHP